MRRPLPPINYRQLNREALTRLPAVLDRLLPGGRREGREYKCLNPRRGDRHIGSFSVNLHTGRWGDFATGDKGGDVVSLIAFLEGCPQHKAAALC